MYRYYTYAEQRDCIYISCFFIYLISLLYVSTSLTLLGLALQAIKSISLGFYICDTLNISPDLCLTTNSFGFLFDLVVVLYVIECTILYLIYKTTKKFYQIYH